MRKALPLAHTRIAVRRQYSDEDAQLPLFTPPALRRASDAPRAHCRFYLGVCDPHWLHTLSVPAFVSQRRLRRQHRWRPSAARWALDSGGFTELSMHGRWTLEPEAYVDNVRQWREELGRMDWAAIQDWMCEPVMIAGTGLSVYEHQRRSVASYLTLMRLAPEVPWVPVVQGWHRREYLACVGMYLAEGVDLRDLPVVGVGTVCRRQHSQEAADIFHALYDEGLRTHGFGLKLQGLRLAAKWLTSADSMAWSFSGRRNKIPGHTHASCANCKIYAMQWREKALAIPCVLQE